MPNLSEMFRWISENESLLSGLAAMLVLSGVILSPVGKALRRIFAGPGRPALPSSSRGTRPATDGRDSEGPTPSASGESIVSDPAEPLLAVLAFDNLSSDSEMQFFSDGVSEEIIQRLSRGATLKVIGRTSSFQFRGERKAEAARSLGCSHVLDGSIRRASGRVRISAHLVEVSSNTTLWSDRYDRELEDIFAVQDEISESIAGALDQAFSRFSAGAIDAAIYDLYLRDPRVLRAGRAAHLDRPAGGRDPARAAFLPRPGAGSPICAPGCTSTSPSPIAPRALAG